MTDPIIKHEQLMQEKQRISQEIEKLEKDDEYQKALLFKNDIEEILKLHKKTKEDLLQLFSQPSATKASKTARRKAGRTFPLKRYTNPYTGEEIIARSLKKPELQRWKAEYNEAEVKSWAKVIEDTDQEPSTSGERAW
ncbi:hypothetical protein DFO67_12616 [Modicisalibacter xianhensis]|uniref:H-NS histone family protein n=1 Tax=Modicisalibacter xianhensis TaxID=442341 RepID=A0A4R8FBD1_9GAMM|nr:hypothetical protein [Halomonas xianhensis]TDX22946.1 hypothetical protein DFO67_12616 [Halomonas xianhensis]